MCTDPSGCWSVSEFGCLTFVWSLKVVDLSSGSESEAELPNPKRTPGGLAKRQRITYDDDESPGLDQDDGQVHLSHSLMVWHELGCMHLQNTTDRPCIDLQLLQ